VSQLRPNAIVVSGDRYVDRAPSALLLGSESIFRYCTFENFFADDRPHVDATFLSCTFQNTEWYWTYFSMCLFSKCVFKDCTFRGAPFVECSFVRCAFVKNNLGSDCEFDGARFFDCRFTDSNGLPS
jgi:uncharacterized protein YjbI with pentapeptide repeats